MAETFADIRFPFSRAGQLTGDITRAVVRRREYQHELLIVDVSKKRGNDLRLRTGSPVVATLKPAGARPIPFHGYVDTVTEVIAKSAASRHVHRVVCVGPTYRMKEGRRKTWRDTTLSDIAKSLCRTYRLHGVIESHPVRKTFHQTGESDWEFLCRVARSYGYVVYAVGTTLHVHSRGYRAQAKHQQAHVLKYVENPDPANTDILTFDGKFSDTAGSKEGRKAKRVASNIDPRRGFSFTVDDRGKPTGSTRREVFAPQFTQYDHIVALGTPDAKAKVKGAQERARWAYVAEAEVRGRADVSPTSVLYLDDLDNGYDGYWTVTGVDHILHDRYRYVIKVSLGTDSVGTPLQRVLPGDARWWTPVTTPSVTLISTGVRGSQDEPPPFAWAAETLGVVAATGTAPVAVRRAHPKPVEIGIYHNTFSDTY